VKDWPSAVRPSWRQQFRRRRFAIWRGQLKKVLQFIAPQRRRFTLPLKTWRIAVFLTVSVTFANGEKYRGLTRSLHHETAATNIDRGTTTLVTQLMTGRRSILGFAPAFPAFPPGHTRGRAYGISRCVDEMVT
jgi:hypothetical protein